MDNINVYTLDKGVSLALIKNKKFKSNYISVYFIRNLDRDEVTEISLLSNMMSTGCEKYRTIKEISKKLDELYGMTMNIGVTKHGEKSISYFKFLTISDKYLDKPIFENVIDFVNEIVFKPLVVDDGINPMMIDIEKDNLADEIKSKINDKKTYAIIKCIEIMCADEPYSINKSGYLEDIDKITPKKLYDTYKQLISTSNILITIEGDYDENYIRKICNKKFSIKRDSIVEINREKFDITPKTVKKVNEDFGTNQGKLVIGYRTGVDYKDYKKYYSLLIANSIFGGGPHSKLFNNVREKESICYYASSNLEKNKGIILVSSGIDAQHYNKALELIRKELDDVINGNITEIEIENAKKSIINSLRAFYDSISGETEYFLNQFISGTDLNINQVIEYIEQATKDEIVESMAGIAEDTIYFLK
ncbi:EF-P 5-aminopentanol modification-associated protein YfmF [Peptostreptococcus canis]|uniref:Insulinase family protein n=1 Tax=Peptostreptococcus canis TaxID=1159213 RepID=A0ABR6TKF9_9FIRM|nr:pitrilysin family protein [Peptostreptococcus canis]MBC2575901.1 insulinase family protein [Peptostreptococcus canis]